METLDRHALISGGELHPAYPWEEGDALKVCLESLTNEDMLRLWESLDAAYRVSLSYLVRTVRLSPVERADAPMVDAVTREWIPRIPLPREIQGMGP